MAPRRTKNGDADAQRATYVLPPVRELKRERKTLLLVREERLRDLGGLTLEMYKRDRFNAGLVVERCAELVAIEARVQEIDSLLDGTVASVRWGRGLPVRRPPAPRCALLRYLRPSGGRRGARARRTTRRTRNERLPAVREASGSDRSTASSAAHGSRGPAPTTSVVIQGVAGYAARSSGSSSRSPAPPLRSLPPTATGARPSS